MVQVQCWNDAVLDVLVLVVVDDEVSRGGPDKHSVQLDHIAPIEVGVLAAVVAIRPLELVHLLRIIVDIAIAIRIVTGQVRGNLLPIVRGAGPVTQDLVIQSEHQRIHWKLHRGPYAKGDVCPSSLDHTPREGGGVVPPATDREDEVALHGELARASRGGHLVLTVEALPVLDVGDTPPAVAASAPREVIVLPIGIVDAPRLERVLEQDRRGARSVQ
mmetsp:Transcript_57133/g.121270  ORF Transcript_57133/g.121270 Transcript_57133/m.121270 type:complete len:217 (-) Transcript_57133:1212-1862(-)